MMILLVFRCHRYLSTSALGAGALNVLRLRDDLSRRVQRDVCFFPPFILIKFMYPFDKAFYSFCENEIHMIVIIINMNASNQTHSDSR